MLLVAVIASGTLIDTGNVLHATAEQAGQENTSQVKNRLDVIDVLGTVTSQKEETDGIEIEGIGGNQTIVDSGAVLTISLRYGDGRANLTSSGTGTLQLNGGESLRVEKVDSSTVRITNVDSGASISFDPADNLQLEAEDVESDEDFVYLEYTYDDPHYGQTTEVVFDIEDTTKSSYSVEFAPRTRSYVRLGEYTLEPENIAVITDGESVTVDSASGDLTNGDGDVLVVSAGDVLTFSPDADAQSFSITHEANGTTLTVDAEGYLNSTDGDIVLDDDGKLVRTEDDGDNSFYKPAGRYVFTRGFLNPGDSYVLSEITLTVRPGPKASGIDLSETTISLLTPDTAATLVYGSTTVETQEFTADAVHDDDSTHPVLNEDDFFDIVIDPGDVSQGSTVIIEMTTPSGATTYVRLRVPRPLASEQTLNLK
ncbi:hypothetical protein KU306_03745 [Haloferax larsenii]|uniref:Flagellin n=1 Tax=Haloferax larsenii TaxID=302484 RepID=A0ABY5RF86_HALLR|nr:hypothetical protein [Haloferax larsenii]UVE51011.1 hypothetical protein KU306_03745 [Haloferax larsenii]